MKYKLEHSQSEIDSLFKIISENSSPLTLSVNGADLVLSGRVDSTKLFTDNGFVVSVVKNTLVLHSSRVNALLSLIEERGHYIIKSDNDEQHLRHLLDRPNSSLNELSLIYNYLTGREVIDYRCTHSNEYTNVSAQSDPDFWSEELINDSINYNVSNI